jgi:hypothetical protein
LLYLPSLNPHLFLFPVFGFPFPCPIFISLIFLNSHVRKRFIWPETFQWWKDRRRYPWCGPFYRRTEVADGRLKVCISTDSQVRSKPNSYRHRFSSWKEVDLCLSTTRIWKQVSPVNEWSLKFGNPLIAYKLCDLLMNLISAWGTCRYQYGSSF